MVYAYRNRIPVTVLSRAVNLVVPPLSDDQVCEILCGKGMLRVRAEAVSKACKGSVDEAGRLVELDGSATKVCSAIDYLLDRNVERFLFMSGKWSRDEFDILHKIMLEVRVWKYRPRPVFMVSFETLTMLSKLKEADVDNILKIFGGSIRQKLKVFAFAEIVSFGRKELF